MAAMPPGAVPEGTQPNTGRRRAWLVPTYAVFAIVFAGYLVFRLVQGISWLAAHL